MTSNGMDEDMLRVLIVFMMPLTLHYAWSCLGKTHIHNGTKRPVDPHKAASESLKSGHQKYASFRDAQRRDWESLGERRMQTIKGRI